MVFVTIMKNQHGQYIGFECAGHAGFAAAGKDIVCAGVSILVINTVNSIDNFTEEKFELSSEEDEGRIGVRFHRPAGHDAALLLDSMALGLKGIQESYGARYITLKFKEV